MRATFRVYTLHVEDDDYGDYTITNDVYAPDNTYQITIELNDAEQAYDHSPEESEPSELLRSNSASASTAETAVTPRVPNPAQDAYSQANVPPTIRVRMANVYGHNVPGKIYCRETPNQPSPARIKNYPLPFYVIHVLHSEGGDRNPIDLNDIGTRTLMSLIQNFAWLHRTIPDPPNYVDVANSDFSQCFNPTEPINMTRYLELAELFWDVRDERIVDDAGLMETYYLDGTKPGKCDDLSLDEGYSLREGSNTASQWGIKAHSEQHEPGNLEISCFSSDRRDIVDYYYEEAHVVVGEAPGRTFAIMGTRTDDTVRLNFFSGDSQEQAPNVERAGTGWRYQLAYRNAGSNKWHHLVTTVWTKKVHDVEKSFVYTLTGECQFVRVRAWNPVGYGPWAWFNNRQCINQFRED